MANCPQCNKPLVQLTRQCPSCRADLDLLVDYVNGLQGSLTRAEKLTRAGELGLAVWAYLEVLEVDPDNPTARRQVGQVATAVRQFDRTMPGRRWAQGLPLHDSADSNGARRAWWIRTMLMMLALVVALALGFLGGESFSQGDPTRQEPKKELPKLPQDNQLGSPK